MMMNKSLLSKLMARENLEVVEGNFSTASFDPENRVLRLPILKEEYKDTSSLFIGHEVGHALYTPNFFSHSEEKELNEDCKDIPHNILNIVEDVRIERKVREFYPGLVNDFLRGYKKLLEDDFFGLKDIEDFGTLSFLDRLNLKAKLERFIDIDFSETETEMKKKVYAIKTFEDTIRVSRELMEFIAKEQEEQQQEQQGLNPNGEQEDGMPDDSESEEQGSESDSDSDEQGSEEQQSSEYGGEEQLDVDDMLKEYEQSMFGEPQKDDSEPQKPDEVPVETSGSGTNEETKDFAPDYSSITEDAYRKNESKMIHHQHGTTLIRVTRKQIKEDFLFSDFDLQESLTKIARAYPDELFDQQIIFRDTFRDFIREVKPSVNAMVQQFELKKSAAESRKAKESTTGSIDVNKLWQYKLDDHIFKTLVSMPDGKNHGLLMYIDYSSSMGNRIYETVKQAIIMVMFARRVGIPFEVYTFTTNRNKYEQTRVNWRHESEDNKFDYTNWAIGFTKVADSSWKKSKLNKMLERTMFNASHYTYGPTGRRNMHLIESTFQLGGTPLNETISVAHIMADDFVKKHNIEKMNVVFLTDGEGQDMRLKTGLYTFNDVMIWDIEGTSSNVELIAEKSWYWDNSRVSYQKEALLASLSKKYNVLGFFLTGVRSHVNRKSGFRVHTDYKGYDKYIVIHDQRLQAINDAFVTSVDDDDDAVATDAKRLNAIKRDFKKFQKGKKSNKLIAQEIANMVA